MKSFDTFVDRLVQAGPPTLGRWINLFRGQTLSRRILLPTLPAVLIVMSLMGVFSYQLVKRQIVGSLRQTIQGEADNTARSVGHFLQQRLMDLDALCNTPVLVEHVKNDTLRRLGPTDSDRRELEKLLVNFAGWSKVYHDISILTPDGRRLCSLRSDTAPEVYDSNFPPDYMNTLRRGTTLDIPFAHLGPKGPILKRYARPLMSQAGTLAGVVVMDVDADALNNLLRAVRVGRRGGVVLEDGTGEKILSTRNGQSFAKMLKGEAPVQETDGRWRWKVIVTAPAFEFLEGPLRQIFFLTILASMGACLVLMVIIVGQVSRLMQPVEALVGGTRRFASGDLTYRFSEFNSVELSLLGQSFNKMAETLESRNRELENRLRQLTALRDMEESVIQRQDEETILRTCLEAVARGFGYDRTGMYWVDEGNMEIVGRCLYGSNEAGFSEAAFRKRRVILGGDDVLNQVVRGREAMLVRENPGEQRGLQEKAREYVLAPIFGKDRVLGILNADNFFTGRPLTEADKEGLRLFANAVGLALENALLFRDLSESESRLRTVLENSPEGMIGLSREHHISTWNRGAEKIFGMRVDEVLGQPLSVLFSGTSGVEFNKLMNLVIERGAVRDFVMPGKNKAGKPLSLSVSWGGAHADFWANKEWTLVVRDITESRRLQQQLIRSEKLSAVGQLISGIAHELNNPLQAVVGYSDILTDDLRQKMNPEKGETVMVDAAQVVDDLRVITENAMRCQKIIENLLLFVRQGEIEKKPLSLMKILDATRDLLQYKLKKAASIKVVVDIPPDIPPVRGNFQQLQQVFVNLINNACDAMGTQEGEKRITVTARVEDDHLRVTVADTGPGVPEMARGHLFEPFFTTKAEGRGTGLGLPVCRQIMEDHEGKITFISEVGKGTTFLLELPIARVEESRPSTAAPALPPVRNKHVLIVDDEPDVLGFLTKVVQAEGNRVDAARSMKEAISQAGNHNFDLVVTDIQLGEGNGLALYENWGLLSNRPRPPFAFMTGDVVNTTLAEDFEKRGLPLLHKPIDKASFQTALRTLLAKV